MLVTNKWIFASFAVWIFSAAGSPLLAHPFHFSSAEMEWNPKSNSFEVSLKVDPNDLEQELRSRTKKKLVLEKLTSHDVVFEYLKRVFQVTSGKEKLRIKPVGFEVETKSAWIYFELPVTEPIGDISITNRLLAQTHHQTNTLLFRFRKQRLTARFHEKETECTFKWDESSETFNSTKVVKKLD